MSVRRFPLAVLLPMILWFAGCGGLSAAPQELVVGMELGYPPFEMTGEKGEPRGVSVEMAEALGRFLGRPVRIQNTAFDGLIPALKTGKIDIVISSMTATPERAKSVEFSDPYLRTGLCLLVGKGSGINGIADADQAGKRIAVKKGTTGYTYAAAELRKAKLRVLDKETVCVLEVVQGRADAFIYDQMSTFTNWRKNPDTTRAVLLPFREENWAIAMRKGDAELKKSINAFLADFKAKGGFERLGDTYLKEQKEEFRKLGIPFFF